MQNESAHRGFSVGLVVFPEYAQGELGGIPELVAEVPVALHTQNVQVDVSTCTERKINA